MVRRERRGTVVILASALAFITSGNYLDDIRFVIVRMSCARIRNRIYCIAFCFISSPTLFSSPSPLYFTSLFLPVYHHYLAIVGLGAGLLPLSHSAHWYQQLMLLALHQTLRPQPMPCNSSNILHSGWDWERERKRSRKGMRMWIRRAEEGKRNGKYVSFNGGFKSVLFSPVVTLYPALRMPTRITSRDSVVGM